VAGLGVGLLAAAVEAGVFSLEEGLRLASGGQSQTADYAAPRLLLVDAGTGAVVGGEALQPDFWREARSQPPRGDAAEQALKAHGVEVCLGLGPRLEWARVLETLGTLYVRGVEVDWAAFDAPYARRRVTLPTYPFQRERYWLKPERTR
jgi:3-oxoacyl-[acyl-carrier-protein] synthase II